MGGMHADSRDHCIQLVSGLVRDYPPSHQILVGRVDVALHLGSKEEKHAGQGTLGSGSLARIMLCLWFGACLLLTESGAL